ncbi:alpha/beta fold hydrolase [Ramlibacter sp. USB13]|uniref:Alpha/beta fold hydrolase n=1 Tax=Ramlibacter cellulosilyticus TaxID=2764187 RepID=A0A923MTA1_9BURK|nr:alpha/beta fold hydrolase [Ramlibacter cellulosilyticus]MBC5784611.1 alpha/beta fold hydrolase [Ramlibacter cellulosilyticus]
MPFVESRGRRIYHERHGDGPAVLFLHGAGSNAATWWQQLPAFTPRHTCLTMDIRCFGRSVAPVEEFSLENFVADVLAVLDAERIERVTLVGQSLGGMIGLKLALDHPSRVAAFAACDTSLAIDHPVLLDILQKRQLTQRAVAIEQRSLGRWFLEHHPDKAVLYAQINHFNPSAHSIPGPAWGQALAGLLAPGRCIPIDALRGLACPTLFLVGSEDPIVPVAVMREVSELVRGSEVVVVDAAGHSTYFEKPQEFNRHVLDFIARRVPASTPEETS